MGPGSREEGAHVIDGQGVGSRSWRSPARKVDAWRLGGEAAVDREVVMGCKNSETSFPYPGAVTGKGG